MEPLFTNKSIYTKANLIEVRKGTSSRKLPTIIIICMGLIIIVCGILTTDFTYCLLGVFFSIGYPLFSLWAVRYSAANRYQQYLQLYHGEAESITSFYEDRFVVHYTQGGGSDVTIAYPEVAKVYETKNLFFLMLSTRIGFMLEKQGFAGTTAEEFGPFIRARAVGEGQADLKKRKRKTALIKCIAVLVLLAIGLSIGFLGPAIENMIPKTFTYGDYSVKLTGAFDGYDGQWYNNNSDVNVYCFYETGDDLSANGLVYDTAAAYLRDTNEYYGINSVVTAVSDTRAWTAYTETYDGTEYYNYDYVIKSDGGFWYTEFYCPAKDADKYAPLFEKWAQTITVPLPL
jgi:hypothetical protein